MNRRGSLLARLLKRLVSKVRGRILANGEPRVLRLREQIPLGDKRTVVIVDCGDESYLIGCTASAVNLLAKLPPRREFTDCLAEHFELAELQ